MTCASQGILAHGGHLSPAWLRASSSGLAYEFFIREEVLDFFSSGFRSVRTVNRVFADGESEFLADRAFGSIFRVGGAHDFTVLQDGIFAFQDLNNNRRRDHLLDEFAEEGAFLV